MSGAVFKSIKVHSIFIFQSDKETTTFSYSVLQSVKESFLSKRAYFDR